jgi:hypothetical protein
VAARVAKVLKDVRNTYQGVDAEIQGLLALWDELAAVGKDVAAVFQKLEDWLE